MGALNGTFGKERNVGKKYYDVKDPAKLTMKEKYGFNGWDIAKTGVGLVASGCATVVLHRYLKGVVPADTTLVEKIVTGLGIYFVAGMVGNKVEKYVYSEMDDIREMFKSAGDAAKLVKEESDGGND